MYLRHMFLLQTCVCLLYKIITLFNTKTKKMRLFLLCLSIITCLLISCNSRNNKKYQKGVTLSQQESGVEEQNQNDKKKTEKLITRPTEVIQTGHLDHRLVSIYKLNYNKDRRRYYTGTNYHYSSYYYDAYDTTDAWHNHFMPGLEAMYGYNMMNIAHYNVKTNERNNFFEQPVLINTLYYPAELTDTTNNQPVTRNYYLVSVYDEDTNQDSIINTKDLRRFYHFDLDAKKKTTLIPKGYSVLSSEYDTENDLMYIYAQHDKNENGRREKEDPIHVFCINLKQPEAAERVY